MSCIQKQSAKAWCRKTYMIICHHIWPPSSNSEETSCPALLALQKVQEGQREVQRLSLACRGLEGKTKTSWQYWEAGQQRPNPRFFTCITTPLQSYRIIPGTSSLSCWEQHTFGSQVDLWGAVSPLSTGSQGTSGSCCSQQGHMWDKTRLLRALSSRLENLQGWGQHKLYG